MFVLLRGRVHLSLQHLVWWKADLTLTCVNIICRSCARHSQLLSDLEVAAK